MANPPCTENPGGQYWGYDDYRSENLISQRHASGFHRDDGPAFVNSACPAHDPEKWAYMEWHVKGRKLVEVDSEFVQGITKTQPSAPKVTYLNV